MLHDRKFWIITKREMRDSLADWRIVIPIVLLTFFFPWVMLIAAVIGLSKLANFVQGHEDVIYNNFMSFAVLAAGFFPISFCLIIALESFVGEKERNTLEVLLSTPVNDADLYLGKALAALVPPLLSAYMSIVIFCIGAMFLVHWTISLSYLALVLLLTTFDAVVMVAGSVVVSSHTTSVRAANLLASFIIIPMSLMIQAEAILVIMSQGQVLWAILGFLVVGSIILVRLGVHIFNREEILAREIDSLNIKKFFQLFKKFFLQTPLQATDITAIELPPNLTLWRIYRLDIPQLLKRERGAIFTTVFVFAAGIIAGISIAIMYPVPHGAFHDYKTILESIPLPFLSLGVMVGVFIANVRTMITAWVLGLFSFGSLAVLSAMVSPVFFGLLIGEVANNGDNPLRFFVVYIAPYALFYVPATIIGTSFIMRGGAMIMKPPKGFTVGASILLATVDWLKMMCLVVPLFLIAAISANYITPALTWLFY